MSLPTTEEIIDDLDFFDDWEERYKYIIDLGKALPEFNPALRTEDRKVKGCQSDVWLDVKSNDAKLQFAVDSDALIVRGLLAVVLAAYQNKSATEITAFDIDGFFSQLDLERHLSPTRGNGLRAVVGKIKAIAEAAKI
jgi:cysteine desulfuration protein SufE